MEKEKKMSPRISIRPSYHDPCRVYLFVVVVFFFNAVSNCHFNPHKNNERMLDYVRDWRIQ